MPETSADQQLLQRMFNERDCLEYEIFSRVYGIDAPEHWKRYRTNGTLPTGARDFCTGVLASTTPRLLT